MKVYTIEFLLNGSYELSKSIEVAAKNKADAYTTAVFEIIPASFGKTPYGAWVASVRYSNGIRHEFNTSCGNPY